MKIAVITCFFGKLPWYFAYYLHSCAHNPSIDFFIITDDRLFSTKKPANTHFIFKTLLEMNLLAAEKLGFPVDIQEGYKICDFKPAYGFLFPKIISGYDYWGHADIDLIYGNLRTFISGESMKVYDIISVRPDWITGCFLLFKNTEKMNTFFMLSKDYKKVFSSSQHFCFDETNFQHDAFTEGKKYYEIPSEIESMMHLIGRMEEQGYLTTYFDLHIVEGRPGRLKWDKGTLTYRNEYEILLYHLIKLKLIYHPCHSPKTIPETYYISPTRIYS